MATEEIAEYAEAVRAALEDIPADDRAELLDDLDDHLAEVAAESTVPLTDRLGPPEVYAAELRAAYGAGGAGNAGWRSAALRSPRVLHRRLLESAAYRELIDFLPELRPGWWVVRGFLVAMLVWRVFGWGLLPHNPVEFVTALLPVWLSVRIGRRARDRDLRAGWRGLLIAANVVAALAVVALFVTANGMSDGSASAVGGPDSTAYAADSGDTTNIFPYSKDGKPLHDVLLYDQNGQPLLTNYSQDGDQLVQPCGGPPPIANSYPLPLQTDPGPDAGSPSQFSNPDGLPIPCSSASPSPSVSPSVSATPRPSGSPSPGHS